MKSALNQYFELYADHKELIDSHSSAALNGRREEARRVVSRYAEEGLPALGSEDYRLTDLQALLEPDYGVNVARVNIDANPAAAFRCDVPNVSTDLCFLINDSFAKTDAALNDLPEGAYVGSLAKNDAIVGKYYGTVADMQNPEVALNTLLCQDGLLVYVPKNCKLRKPVQLVNLLSSGAPLMAVRRILVVLEEGAEAQILVCDHTQNDSVDFLSLQTVEIIVGRNAHLDYYDLEESTPLTKRLSTLYVRQEADSRLLVNGMTLYNGLTRNEYRLSLEGEGCETHLYGMGIADDDRRIDTLTLIDHKVPRCRSNELYKYSADDKARCAFAGRILVRPGASATDSYQSNRNLLGSGEARIYSKPQLEIYNDDVKCSHGSATGQLDAMQLFYMRTRGIDEDAAKLLLKQAFMADIIDSVTMPGLQERLHLLVERRFTGDSASCASCPGRCNNLK